VFSVRHAHDIALSLHHERRIPPAFPACLQKLTLSYASHASALSVRISPVVLSGIGMNCPASPQSAIVRSRGASVFMATKKSEHVLLVHIVQRGWTERLGCEFEAQFGQQLRWLIVVTMERIGTLQWRVNPQYAKTALEDRRLALYENTLSDLWSELLNGLVQRYVEGQQSGRIHQEFVPYLRGVVRHLVISNARTLRLIGRETAAEMLTSVCDAKRDTTYVDRLAWLKFCFEKKVRQELLIRATPEAFSRFYRSIHRVSDYFFERYVPEQCDRISRSRGSALQDLLDAFGTDVLIEDACEYIGTITPTSRDIDDSYRTPAGEDEAEHLGAQDFAQHRGRP
jgi:hypothetical protein